MVVTHFLSNLHYFEVLNLWSFSTDSSFPSKIFSNPDKAEFSDFLKWYY